MAHKIQTTSKSLKRKIQTYNTALQTLVDYNQQRNLKEMDVTDLTLKKGAWQAKKATLETKIEAANNQLEAIIRVIKSYKHEYTQVAALDPNGKKVVMNKLNAAYEMFYNESMNIRNLNEQLASITSEIDRTESDLAVAKDSLYNIVVEIKKISELLNIALKEIEKLSGKRLGSEKFIPGIISGEYASGVAPIEIE